MARAFYVYIMTNYMGTTLYTGVTNDPPRRVMEHRDSGRTTFAGRYKVTRLIYIEETKDIREAIQREKEIKGWSRKKKLDLIATQNPRWEDLTDGWLEGSKPDLG